jgi:intracellular multiplication protein IcmB
MDSLFNAVSELIEGVGAIFSTNGNSFIDIETVDSSPDPGHSSEGFLVRPNGTLVSLIEVRGSRALVGPSESAEFFSEVFDAAQALLSRPGYTMQIVFRRDTDTSMRDIGRALAPARVTSDRLGADMQWVLDARQKSLSGWCSSEYCWIAISTGYGIFPKVEAKRAAKERADLILKEPFGRGAQMMAGVANSLRASHQAAVNGLLSQLDNAKIVANLLPAHDALHVFRREIDPEATADNWRALLPGDPIPVRMKESKGSKDFSNVLYPRIKDQVMPRPASAPINNRWVEIGDRIYAPVVMSTAPQDPSRFQVLLGNTIGNSNIPFRISFMLTPNGEDEYGLKSTVSSILHFTSNANKQFNKAIDTIKARVLKGETFVGFRVSACTWARAGDEETLRRRSEYLQKAIQSWGMADTRDVVGDPLLGVMSTIPAITLANPAPITIAPLAEVVSMFPLDRPTSLWRDGALLLRTPDGRLLPYQPGSSLQTSWVTLGFAAMGKGKSVLLNALNLAMSLSPGIERLPLIAILDIGISSSGLISLLKYSLPEHRRDEVNYIRMKMKAEYAVNPCDTPPGLRRPLAEHRTMLANFLTTLCTPDGERHAPDGISGIAQTVIDLVYDDIQPDRNPKRYDPKQAPAIHKRLIDLGLLNKIDAVTSWFEVADMLFEHGDLVMWRKAHVFAMPMLLDVARLVTTESITNLYRGVAPNGERLPDYFWGKINEAIGKYPILSLPTQFDIGNGRIVALDLEEVCPQGSAAADAQTGIMYMLGRYILAQRFYASVGSADEFPPLYRDHYRKEYAALAAEPKVLSMDEFHRTAGVEGTRAQIVRDIREGRKYNVQIALFSQSIHDFDPIMVSLSSTRFVMGAETPEDARLIAERFGLSKSAANIIYGRIQKPDSRGSGVYLSTRTAKGDGEFFAYLTLGPMEMWAFDTTAINRSIRDTLYARVGVRRAIMGLVKRFPKGSAVEEVERRRQSMGVYGDDEASNAGLIEAIVNEVLEIIERDN